MPFRRNNQRTKDYKETDSEILLRRSCNTDLNYDAKDFYTYDNNKRKEPALEFIREKYGLVLIDRCKKNGGL